MVHIDTMIKIYDIRFYNNSVYVLYSVAMPNYIANLFCTHSELPPLHYAARA